jgi:hypothetical protein
MSMNLLNADQQRRLGTHLRLLVSDLDTLSQAPELGRDGPDFARVREALARSRDAAQDIQSRLELPAEPSLSLRRRVAAVAEVWAARVEDLRARRLAAYGAVHPDLEKRLDPGLEDLGRRLEDLAAAAARLPGGER